MLFDYVLRNGRIAGGSRDPVDAGVRDGRIAAIASGSAMSARDSSRDIALEGRLMIPGFVETHIHLDKSCISDRCNCVTGTLQEAIAAAAAAKRDFTEPDIYAKASRTLEKTIIQGTTRMSTHVEVDPRIVMKGFHALRRLQIEFTLSVD